MLWEENKIFRREDIGKGCNFKCIGQTFEEEKMSQDCEHCIFQVEEKINGKALRWECAWYD